MRIHQRPLLLRPPLFTLLLLFIHHHPILTHSLIDPTTFSTFAAAAPTTNAPTPTPNSTTTTFPTEKDTEFIRTSCASTRYPELCYRSLSGYASAIQQNPARLARVAIAISLSHAKQQAAYFSNLSKEADYGAEHRVAAALHDCFSCFDDAVDQIRGSLKQMRHLVAAAGSSVAFRFQMSNVQTWMSAALSNEDTCTDGFDDVSEGPMKRDVHDRVQKVEAVTSNALALVNAYATMVSSDSTFP